MGGNKYSQYGVYCHPGIVENRAFTSFIINSMQTALFLYLLPSHA